MENQTMENQVMEVQELEMQPRFNKKRIGLIAAIICCIAVLAGGTLAYFVAEETSYNVITTGVLSMDLVEETADGEPWPAWPEDGISGVMPGQIVDKVAYVVNDGGVDFYTRIAIEKIITAAEGVTEELNFDNITLDINEEYWTEQDGFYYYYAAVKPDEQTEPLFTKVTFEPSLGNEYQDAYIEIIVNAQAVQSRNNTDSALTATGWADIAE